MSFYGFLITVGVMLLVAFLICAAVLVIAIKIKIDRRKKQNQYYDDIHKIASHLDDDFDYKKYRR